MVHGDVNPEEFPELLPDSYSEQSSRDGYTIYADEDSLPTIAVTDGFLVAGPKRTDTSTVEAPIERLLDASDGDHLDSDPLTRALRAAGDGLLVSANVDSEGFTVTEFEGIRAGGRALDIDNQQMRSTWAFVFEGEDSVPDESTIGEFETGFARETPFPEKSFEHETDGTLVTVEAKTGVESYWSQ